MSPQKHHTPGSSLWELSEKDREHAAENAILECQGCYNYFPHAILFYCDDCGDLFCEDCRNSDGEHGCEDYVRGPMAKPGCIDDHECEGAGE